MPTRAPPCLQAGDCGGLAVGQDVGDHLVDAHLGGDGRGGLATVAGQHDHAQAEIVQTADGVGGARLDRVGDGDQAGRPAVDGHVDRGLAGGGQHGGRLGAVASRLAATVARRRRRVPAAGVMKPLVAGEHLVAGDHGSHAVAGNGLEIGRVGQLETALGGGPHDGRGERVLRAAFGGRGQAQELVGRDRRQPAGRRRGRAPRCRLPPDGLQ